MKLSLCLGCCEGISGENICFRVCITKMLDCTYPMQFCIRELANSYAMFLNPLRMYLEADEFCKFERKENDAIISTEKITLQKILIDKNVAKNILDSTDEKIFKMEKDSKFRIFAIEFLKHTVFEGNLQFVVISWAMRNLIPSAEIVHYAFLIGFNNKTTVRRLRSCGLANAIDEAISWKDNEDHWRQALERFNLSGKDQTIRFAVFCENMRHFGPQNDACKVIKALIERHIAGEICLTTLFDNIYYKIAQDPKIKAAIIQVMQKAQLSEKLIEEIRKIDFANANPNSIPDLKCENVTRPLRNVMRLSPEIRIQIIEEQPQFQELIAKFEQVSRSDYNYVALDMLNNSHSNRPENQVKYLMVAIKHAVYLVRLTTHNSTEYHELCESLFHNAKLVKICFDSSKSDLKHFISCRPNAIRDLRKETGTRQLPIRKPEICEKLFGKSLDQSERCSVWSREPLRQAQIEYAALEAYCLLIIRDKLDNYDMSCE